VNSIADPEALADAMDALATFLKRLSRPGDPLTIWVNWVSKDATRVRAGDYYGVEHFLQAFGGMGSINDLTFGANTPEFSTLKQRAWELARQTANSD